MDKNWFNILEYNLNQITLKYKIFQIFFYKIAKHLHFNSTQTDYEKCRILLLEKPVDMNDEGNKMVEANVTIAHEEGILESLRDEQK